MSALGDAFAPTRCFAGRRPGGCGFGTHGLREAVERKLPVVGDKIRDRALVGDAAEPFGLLAIIKCVRHD